MFRFYLPRVYKTTTSLFNGNSTTSSRFLPTPFLLRSFCVNNATEESSFTVSYLIKSCGLSEKKAISLSKKIQLKSSSQPDTVLTLFRHHKFPDIDIFKIIVKHPNLLLSNADETLKPKIEFLKSLGLSGPDLAKLLAMEPSVFSQSLERKIIPCVNFLKSILPTDSNVTSVIKRSPWIFERDPQKRLIPNIAALQSHGTPNHNILKVLVHNPSIFTRSNQFKAVVEEAKRMQFDPSKFAFVRAVDVLASMSKSSWVAKTEIYKIWGWSDNDILTAFRIHPQCMMQSKKKITDCMEFLVNKLGYDSLFVSKHPMILTYSLEKRIVPRLSIIRFLISNNIVEGGCHIAPVLQLTDKAFLKKFVTKFKEQLPQLLDVYNEKTNTEKVYQEGNAKARSLPIRH